MKPEEQLKALIEIEKLAPPHFETLLDTTYYDIDFNKTNDFNNRMYVSLNLNDFHLRIKTENQKSKGTKQVEFLKNVIPYVEYEGLTYFDYKILKDYLQNELPQLEIPII